MGVSREPRGRWKNSLVAEPFGLGGWIGMVKGEIFPKKGDDIGIITMGGDRSLMAFFHHSSFSGSRLHHKGKLFDERTQKQNERQAGRQIWLKETKRKGKGGGEMD